MDTHAFYMRRCIALGHEAKAKGDNPVGAILVKDHRIAAESMEASKTTKDVTRHAEIEVIRDLVSRLGITDLSGYILYTTHEPCIMCAYVIRHHRISTVAWGLPSSETGGYSSAYKVLEDTTVHKWGPPPLLIKGVLETECRTLCT